MIENSKKFLLVSECFKNILDILLFCISDNNLAKSS